MRVLRKLLVTASMVALLLASFAAAPARGAAAAPADTVQCALEPGVYGIVDSSGDLIGILIIYPDCRMEIRRAVLV